ncbi:MAG: HemK family protein methyltransferase [Candidatus Staskawiczbacteria bacterium]|nr:HemK family protein methyltransferase [Candidatus Staskawiczbacteria bacterium]
MKIEEPIEYVRGFTNFLQCRIDLSKKPLIPRPETEFWVQQAINDILIFSRISECPIRVLDIFSGSGCIGIAVLKHVKNSRVFFVDKDKRCLEQTKINLRINKLKGIVRQSDVFSNIKDKYDFVFANPPYVAKNMINKIQKSVLKFEPKVALFGGNDGLYYIRKFLGQAKKHLNPNGVIFMEFSPEQKNKIEKLLKKNKYKNWQFNKDQYGRWRYVVVFA